MDDSVPRVRVDPSRAPQTTTETDEIINEQQQELEPQHHLHLQPHLAVPSLRRRPRNNDENNETTNRFLRSRRQDNPAHWTSAPFSDYHYGVASSSSSIDRASLPDHVSLANSHSNCSYPFTSNYRWFARAPPSEAFINPNHLFIIHPGMEVGSDVRAVGREVGLAHSDAGVSARQTGANGLHDFHGSTVASSTSASSALAGSALVSTALASSQGKGQVLSHHQQQEQQMGEGTTPKEEATMMASAIEMELDMTEPRALAVTTDERGNLDPSSTSQVQPPTPPAANGNDASLPFVASRVDNLPPPAVTDTTDHSQHLSASPTSQTLPSNCTLLGDSTTLSTSQTGNIIPQSPTFQGPMPLELNSASALICHEHLSAASEDLPAMLVQNSLPPEIPVQEIPPQHVPLQHVPLEISPPQNTPLQNTSLQNTPLQNTPLPRPATGFAKLEFSDGHFYMTTYAVELGRDMRAFKLAQHQLQLSRYAKPIRAASSSRPVTPHRAILPDGSYSVRSFISESGGIMGDDDEHIALKPRGRKMKRSAKSTDTSSNGSHSKQISRKNSVGQPLADLVPLDAPAPAPVPTIDPNATAALDPSLHMPNPDYVPLIPIHPPMSEDEPFPAGKGISRRHVRIAYNFDRARFEMMVFGRNGAFHDDEYHGWDETVALHDGSMIQIGGVFIRFVLPNVPVGDVDDGVSVMEEPESQSGRMSFSFEDGRGESINPEDLSPLEDEEEGEGLQPNHEQWHLDPAMYENLSSDGSSDEEEEEVVEVPQDRIKLKLKVAPKKISKQATKQDSQHESKLQAPRKGVKIAKKSKKARAKERAKAAVDAKERASQSVKTKKAAPVKESAKETPEVAKPRPKEASKESSKEPSKESSKEPPKVGGKQPAKDSGTEEGKVTKEPAVPRIARDTPLENGAEVHIVGLPAGAIIPARKKGPGRPPKDGIMSKREKAQLIKQDKERQKAIKAGVDPNTIPMAEEKPPKPKPRRNSRGEAVDADGGTPDGERKPKPPRPPRSPSPEMRIEDYTEEQLKRPSPNYSHMIHDAIRASVAGCLNLQQIYSSIERRYPYFKFKVTSNGWQSSVRHNLGQHDVFIKVEKEGKGWLWGIKEGVPLERERKKKTPPPTPPPQQYPHAQYPYPSYGYSPQMGAPQYAHQRHPASLVPPSLAQQALKPPPSLAQPSISTVTQAQTYSSPYAKDTIKPGEGSNAQVHPPMGSPYQPFGLPYPPSTPHPPGSIAGGSALSAPSYQSHPSGYQTSSPWPPPASITPPITSGRPMPAPRPRGNVPTPDVINTFKQVFLKNLIETPDQDIGPAEAAGIIDRVIQRTMDPGSMINVPIHPQEDSVFQIFQKVVMGNQAPPRQAMSGQSAPVQSLATSAAATAAQAVSRANIGPNPMAQGQNGATSAGRPPPGPHPLPAPASTSTLAVASTATTKQPQPHRPAEATLMSMLMVGSGPSCAPTITPPVSANSTSPAMASARPSSANMGIGSQVSTPKKAGVAKLNGVLGSIPNQAGIADGDSTPARPDFEPITPPAISSSPKLGVKRASSVGSDRGVESSEHKRVKRSVENGEDVDVDDAKQ